MHLNLQEIQTQVYIIHVCAHLSKIQRVNRNKVPNGCQTFRSAFAPLRSTKSVNVSAILMQISRQQLRLGYFPVRCPNCRKGLSCCLPRGAEVQTKLAHLAFRRGSGGWHPLYFWRSPLCNIVENVKFDVRSFSMRFWLFWSIWIFRAILFFLGLVWISWGWEKHPVRRFLRWEATGIPTFVDGHASSLWKEHARRAQLVVSVIWNMMLSKASARLYSDFCCFPCVSPKFLTIWAANRIRNCAFLPLTSSRETTWSTCHLRPSCRWSYRMCARRWRLGGSGGC